jgi:hypothetical protein
MPFSLAGLRRLLPLAALVACSHTPPAAAPTSTAHAKTPDLEPRAIDAMLEAAWKTAGVVPAQRADDATFLRRAYVDLVGTVPLPDDTSRFIEDPSPDKRAKLVDALLASPAYAEHWTNYWDDVLMGRETKGVLVDRGAFRYWLRERFAANAPWDQVVRELVAATGQNSLGGPRTRGPGMVIPMGAPVDREGDEGDPASINGAVNWTLRFEQTPQDLGASASRIFLGVQIQCAQCHDHKTEHWKQSDFRQFSSAFFHTRVRPLEGKAKGVIKRVDLVDLAGAPPRFAKNAELAPLVHAKAVTLDGTSVEKGTETRRAMAAWITSKQNPWFAKAFVNRMWGHLMGRGFYDPVDDIRPSNPGTLPELLDRVAADFAAHDFDVKRLLRQLCATEAYQLASSASAKTDPENKLWGRFHLVPLGPEELLNAVLRVTDLENAAKRAGIQNFDALRAGVVKQYAFLFDTDEEDDEPDYSGTVSQVLALVNGALVERGSRVLPGSALEGLTRGPGATVDKLDHITLRVLGRHATADEKTRWASYVEGAEARQPLLDGAQKAKPAGATGAPRGPLERLGRRGTPSARQAAFEDILWSMLNSSEFTFNH